ncbi:hypothetical protein [Methylobacterium sp. AMS5]|uniref:hypothetical protein n=1 Tax=Methylobacterium sp. AMS5 TaxID=925818 RepID=UPI00074F9A5E|nr:hypothetical protein [Methylobacterium sp. AMS5]AMB48232.1 hypothetical protein Y590_25020 [Methylobacterium sp. AMS5]
MTLIKSYSPKNEAKIVCPIFNAETKIADCFTLEQQLARGQVQEERRGCQACMRSSKCPVYWINREIQRTGEDHYHAGEPKVLSLKPGILDAIAPIVVQERHINELGVSGVELDAIVAANDTTSSGAKRAKKAPAVSLGRVKAEERSVPRAAPAAESDDVTQAALSGDMSAAITKAAVGKPVMLDLSDVRPSGPPIAPEPKPEPAKVEAPKFKSAPKPAPAPAADAPKGLSLLERARLMAAQKAA